MLEALLQICTQQHLLQYLNTNIMNAGKIHHPHIWECGGRGQSPWRVLILWLCEKKNITTCFGALFWAPFSKKYSRILALFWATFSHIQEFWALFGLLLMANWAPKFLRTWQHCDSFICRTAKSKVANWVFSQSYFTLNSQVGFKHLQTGVMIWNKISFILRCFTSSTEEDHTCCITYCTCSLRFRQSLNININNMR